MTRNDYENEMLMSMMNTIIRKYGLESEQTLAFCEMVEAYQKNRFPQKKIEIYIIFNEIAWQTYYSMV